MKNCPLIAFSGIDGAGKSTQIELLMKYFRDTGRRPVYLWSRGGYTSFLENIKILLRKILKRYAPHSGHSEKRNQYFKKKGVRRFWLYAALLDLMRVYGINIRFWRMIGRPVICDRYLWDTLLDFKINFPKEDVEDWVLWRIFKRIAAKPDVAFLFMIPIDESVRRSEIKKDPFPEPIELRQKRYALYEKLARDGDFHVIDGTRPVAEIFEEIKRVIA